MKSYKEFIKGFMRSYTGNSIESICKEYDIENYTINEDGTIDVDGGVSLSNGSLTRIPLKFGKVTGDFYCRRNELASLEGSPREVGGGFYCANNKLTSLEGCPEIIVDNFLCSNNQITDFKGVPEFFEGYFYCDENPIEEIYTLFLQENDVDDSKCIKWINEFDVIQGNKVVLDRLEEVYHQLNMVMPENITFKNYEII